MAQLKLPGMEALFGTHLGLVKASGQREQPKEMVSLAESATATLGHLRNRVGGEHRLVQKAS